MNDVHMKWLLYVSGMWFCPLHLKITMVTISGVQTFLWTTVTLKSFPLFLSYLLMICLSRAWQKRTSPIELRQVSILFRSFSFISIKWHPTIILIWPCFVLRAALCFDNLLLIWNTLRNLKSTKEILIVSIVLIQTDCFAAEGCLQYIMQSHQPVLHDRTNLWHSSSRFHLYQGSGCVAIAVYPYLLGIEDNRATGHCVHDSWPSAQTDFISPCVPS